ncbi:hypothetical protein ACFLYV_03945 [Chloroflexota bacterium]
MDYGIRKRLWSIEHDLVNNKPIDIDDEIKDYIIIEDGKVVAVNWLKLKRDWAGGL